MDALVSKQLVRRYQSNLPTPSAAPNYEIPLTDIFTDDNQYAEVKISMFGNIPAGVANGFFVRYSNPPFPPLSNIVYSRSKLNNTAGAVSYSDSVDIVLFPTAISGLTHLQIASYNTMASAVGTIAVEALVYKL